MDGADWVALALAVVACGVAGLAVPAMVRALPEPEVSEAVEGEPEKPLYVDLAARSRLGLWSAVAGAVAVGAAALVLGAGWPLIYMTIAVPPCVLLAYVDWHTRLLPIRVVLPTTGLLVVLALVEWGVTRDTGVLVRTGLTLVVVRSIFWVLWFIRSAGMGFGDVRLAALLGLVLGRIGVGEAVVGMYAGFLVFGVPGLALAIATRDRSRLKTAYPFGPAMVVGALLGVLVGAPVAALL
ncbi:prepilin peptidase [Nocardioides acrostichi]|uniref:Prepilin peptidase n=1 Tax=Nocardioides acrostichi TaxID=2784339 RepID=A0A930V1U4_9ACTN|nr:A24 family peptidase [Nocardioides acrostichi]MBF4162180.1 prepilin peptidase [Nocardioides acrostichi]